MGERMKTAGRAAVFAVFIVMPMVCFLDIMHSLNDEGLFGMFIRYINTAALPFELLGVAVFNLTGFCVLKKSGKWRQAAFIWFIFQGAASLAAAVVLALSGGEITGISIFINDIVKSEAYISHSMILMCLLNIVTFLLVSVINYFESKKDRQ